LDDQGNQDIGLRTTLSVRGGDTRLGVGIEWGGRGIVGGQGQRTEDNNPSSPIPSQSINGLATNTTEQPPSSSFATSTQLTIKEPNSSSGVGSQSNISNDPIRNNNVLAENPNAAAIQQLYQRLQEKDVQIQTLQQQITELQQSLEDLRCQLPENQINCQKVP
jgi:TolA-binding protein